MDNQGAAPLATGSQEDITKMWMDSLAQGATMIRGGDSPSMLGSGYNNAFLMVAPRDQYAVGEDIVFRDRNGGMTGHRVAAVKPGHVFTKGTFNATGDGWIPLKDVVGKIILNMGKK